MKNLGNLLVYLACFSAASFAQSVPKIERLELRNRTTHPMTATETHRYQLALKADQYFSLRLEQLGIDVVIDVFGPDGKLIEEFDAPTGAQGPEVVSLVAPSNGDYRIDVRAFDTRAQGGSYEIELEDIRPAEPRDKQYEADRQHSKDLANKLAEAVAKRDDDAVVRRFQDGVQEIAHPKAEPALLLVRVMEAIQLASTYRTRGDYRRGSALANSLLEATEKSLGPNNRAFPAALAPALQSSLDLADNERAAALMVKAAPFLDPKKTDLATYLRFIELQAGFQLSQKQYFDAQTSYESAIGQLEQISTSNNLTGIVLYNSLATAFEDEGNYLQSETNYRKAISIAEKVAPTTFHLGFSLQGLSDVFRFQKKYQEAEEPIERASRILEEHYGSNHPDTSRAQMRLAMNEVHLGRLPEAQPLFERAVKSLGSILGENNPVIAEWWKAWAHDLQDIGKAAEASEALARAAAINSGPK